MFCYLIESAGLNCSGLVLPDPDNSAVFLLNKNDFNLKTALCSSLLQSNIYAFCQFKFLFLIFE